MYLQRCFVVMLHGWRHVKLLPFWHTFCAHTKCKEKKKEITRIFRWLHVRMATSTDQYKTSSPSSMSKRKWLKATGLPSGVRASKYQALLSVSSSRFSRSLQPQSLCSYLTGKRVQVKECIPHSIYWWCVIKQCEKCNKPAILPPAPPTPACFLVS